MSESAMPAAWQMLAQLIVARGGQLRVPMQSQPSPHRADIEGWQS